MVTPIKAETDIINNEDWDATQDPALVEIALLQRILKVLKQIRDKP